MAQPPLGSSAHTDPQVEGCSLDQSPVSPCGCGTQAWGCLSAASSQLHVQPPQCSAAATLPPARPPGSPGSKDAWRRLRVCSCRRNCLCQLCPCHLPLHCAHSGWHTLLMPRALPDSFPRGSGCFLLLTNTLQKVTPNSLSFPRLSWHAQSSPGPPLLPAVLQRGSSAER